MNSRLERGAVAIVNPATGRRSGDEIAHVLRVTAAARTIPLRIVETQHPGHAIELARDAANVADVVIAVGGDGTVSDVVTGVYGTQATVGVMPAGTTNMVAKDLGIPRRIADAAHVALGGGRVVHVDVARVNDTTCVHIAGAGYDAEIMTRATARWKRRVGWLAYLPPALSMIRYRYFNAYIRVDGREARVPARLILCALGGSIVHPRIRLGAGIDRHDGLIDILVYAPPHLPATLTCLAWIATGRPERSRWQHQFRGRVAHIDADRPVPYEVDGDPLGILPMAIEVLPEPARILVPSH